MKRKKAHAAWRRLLTVILAVAMAVSWSPGGGKSTCPANGRKPGGQFHY